MNHVAVPERKAEEWNKPPYKNLNAIFANYIG